MKYKILIADDHKVFRQGFKSLIEKHDKFDIVGEASNGFEATKLCKKLNPDIVIMDISMPKLNGIDATKEIKEFNNNIKIIILSMHSEKQLITHALNNGVSGYLLKSSTFDEIKYAIEEVIENNMFLSSKVAATVVKDYLSEDKPSNDSQSILTSRERQVLQLISEGNKAKEIASLLNVSVKTIDGYRANLMKKLDLHNVAVLTKYAIKVGLTTVDF